jgi:hypothetical protein
MSEQEQVKSAVDTALAQVRAAIKMVSENKPAGAPQTKGLLGSIRAAVAASDDPRSLLLGALTNAIHQLEACQVANEHMRRDAGT